MTGLDILAIGIHPDDVELGCGGTIVSNVAKGRSVGVLDLSRGEMGTRGNPKLRTQEAMKSADCMGINFREQLEMEDCFFSNDKAHLLLIVKKIREHRPKVVLCNAISDRHPDHGRAARLVADGCFYAGLRKIETGQSFWRPNSVYHYIQDHFHHPNFVLDVSDFAKKKREAILCYDSQFFNPESVEPETAISSEDFLESVFAKMRIWGRSIGVSYGEGFMTEKYIGVRDIFDIH